MALKSAFSPLPLQQLQVGIHKGASTEMHIYLVGMV